LDHGRRELGRPPVARAFHFGSENSSQNLQPGADLLWSKLREAEPQPTRLRPRYREIPAGKIAHTLALCSWQQLARVQRTGQLYPKAHPAARPSEARSRREIPLARR